MQAHPGESCPTPELSKSHGASKSFSDRSRHHGLSRSITPELIKSRRSSRTTNDICKSHLPLQNTDSVQPAPTTANSQQNDHLKTTDTQSAGERSVDPLNNEGNSAGRGAAALLLVTHVLELTAMVAATLSRVLPTTHSSLLSSSSHVTNSHITTSSAQSLPYSAPLLLVITHILLLITPLVIVTTVSLVWTLRAQDFSGRSAARLVCWLLHLFQASLVWRYLKIQLAYDPSDVAELGTLRFVQVHIHTLPFLVLHVAATLASPKALGLSLTLGIALLVSSVITIVIATTVRRSTQHSSLSLPTISQVCTPPVGGESEVTHKEDATARIVVGITAICVLWCRAVSTAALFSLNVLWASSVIFVHWLIAFIWLCFQDELQTVAMNNARKWLRRAFLAYLLVWDWHVFRDDASALNVCARPRLPAIFYTIVTTQNLVASVIWFAMNCYNNTSLLCIATISSVTIAQVIALILLILSYLYCSSLLPNWPGKVASIATTRKVSLVTHHNKAYPVDPQPTSLNETIEHSRPTSSSYIDFKDIEEGNGINENNSRDNKEEETLKIKTPKLNSAKAYSTPKYSISSRLLTQNLPPSMFSFSHDMLPPATKSERSSTDNGSFNSRNTNTLVPTATHLAEYETLHKPHGSFSDSFSSLSCGTIQRNMSNMSKINNSRNYNTNSLNSKSKLRRHTSCQNGFCHCKIFDVVGHRCEENVAEEEVDEEDEEEEKQSGTENNKSSTPRVSVVRGAQRFQVVCSACLHSHDPLLTRCQAQCRHAGPPSLSQSCGGIPGGGSSTDYPSDTELTATVDTLSSISAESHSTYTTWPVGRGPGLARLLSREKGGHDYVTAWLRHQQARGPPPPPPPNYSTQMTPRRVRGGRRQISKQIHRSSAGPLVQDLETVV